MKIRIERSKLVIWTACNVHKPPRPELCSRCATAQDMNDRQAAELMAAQKKGKEAR